MGGYGSGRHLGGAAKKTTNACYTFDVNRLARTGFFDGDGHQKGVIRWTEVYTKKECFSLKYELTNAKQWLGVQYAAEDGEQISYDIPLTSTQLPWGGVRRWFTCSATCDGQYCGRRVAKLYLPCGARYFACRHCYSLTYESCRESRKPPCSSGMLGSGFALLEYEVLRRLKEQQRRKAQVERRAEHNEQRRRRRKAQNWK